MFSKHPKDKKPKDLGDINSKIPKQKIQSKKESRKKILLPPEKLKKEKITKNPQTNKAKNKKKINSRYLPKTKIQAPTRSKISKLNKFMNEQLQNKNSKNLKPRQNKFRPSNRNDIPKTLGKNKNRTPPRLRNDGLVDIKSIKNKTLVLKQKNKSLIKTPSERSDVKLIQKNPPKGRRTKNKTRIPTTSHLKNKNQKLDLKAKIPKEKIPKQKRPV